MIIKTMTKTYDYKRTILTSIIAMTMLTSTIAMGNLSYAHAGIPEVGTMYGSLGNGGSNPGAVVTITQFSGFQTLVGDPTPSGGLAGLAFDDSGRLFGSTVQSSAQSSIIEIDPTDGSLISTNLISVDGQAVKVQDLAVQPGTNLVFGYTEDDLAFPENLITIDPSTGLGTLVGAPGVFDSAIGFAPDGTLYLIERSPNGSLHTIDPTDGSILTSVAKASFFETDALGVRSDGLIFISDTTFGSFGSGSILIIDPTDGSVDLVGVGEDPVADITFEREQTPDSLCYELTDGTLPNGIGVLGLDSTLVKCFDAENPCFADGIPVKDDEPNQCSFAVFGANSYGDSIIISDAIPAEWEIVTFDPFEDNCDYDQANKGKKADKSATLIECVGGSGEYIGFSTLVQTRESPGKGHQETTYKPTSCGDLYLNEGAVMLLGDEDGEPILEEVEDGVFEPIVLAQTGPLMLDAVAEVCEPELG
jgi:hypothetical protein